MKSSRHGASPCWHAFCVAHFSQSRLALRRPRKKSLDLARLDPRHPVSCSAIQPRRARPRTRIPIGRHAFQSPTTRIVMDDSTRPKRQRGRTPLRTQTLRSRVSLVPPITLADPESPPKDITPSPLHPITPSPLHPDTPSPAPTAPTFSSTPAPTYPIEERR